MKIAVLSGKGGTGKTFVSVQLASCASSALYLDCDVEAPNGHLFFKPERVTTQPISVPLPIIDKETCQGCRTCANFCHFNAIAFIGKRPRIFPDICHSCGGCALLCPHGAITETLREIGTVSQGSHKNVTVVTGTLNLGEASGVPIIKEVLAQSQQSDAKTVVIDCPPGSACTVMESIQDADYCLLVAEPTAFGIHNLKMVQELVTLIGKPFGVVINKAPPSPTPLDDYCTQQGIKVLATIPYEGETAQRGAMGVLLSDEDSTFRQRFQSLLHTIAKEVARWSNF